MYVHTYIHTHTCTFIHVYICTFIHTYINTLYIHSYVHSYIHTYIRMYVCTYIRTFIHTFIPTYICTVHTFIHTAVRFGTSHKCTKYTDLQCKKHFTKTVIQITFIHWNPSTEYKDCVCRYCLKASLNIIILEDCHTMW